MALSLLLEEREIIHLCSKVTVSGSIKQCGRTLKADIASNLYDIDVYTDPKLSQLIRFYEDGALIFFGTIFTVTYNAGRTTKSIEAFDMGYFLKNNYATYDFKNVTAESVLKRVCREYYIPINNIASTGFTFSRKVSGAALDVIEKGTLKSKTIIEDVSNLQRMSYMFHQNEYSTL